MSNSNNSGGDRLTLVVGIGSSAGGLESLGRFLSAVEGRTEMAFIVVQHLSPNHPSMMPELLARHTHLAVHNVENQELLKPETVYLVPPGRQPIVKEGRLFAEEPEPGFPRYPISRFFRSLAETYRDRAVAIVLSGSGSDGSGALDSFHHSGGLILTESDSAAFSGMPSAAFKTGKTHASMVPEAMPALLGVYRETLSISETLSVCNQESAESVGLMRQLLKLLQERHQIDFSVHKQKSVSRRVLRRITLHQDKDLGSYLERVREDPAECSALCHDLLIGVTRFLRDPQAWDILGKTAVRAILSRCAEEGEECRVWVAGCSTGEEAYTIAAVCFAEMEALGLRVPLRVFATDINEAALRTATEGIYRAEAVEEMPAEYISAMFNKHNEHYVVREGLRRAVLFSKHNLLEDPPFGRIDLSICRNLLIYFNAAAQRRAIAALHFSLRLQGILFLGPSESLGELDSEYETLGGKWNIFQKKSNRKVLILQPFKTPHKAKTPVLLGQRLQQNRQYERVLAAVVGDAALVDRVGQVQHLFGDMPSLLRPTSGPMNTTLTAMCPDSLGVLVGTTLRQALQTRAPVSVSAQLNLEQEPRDCTIHVTPVMDDNQQAENLLVRFEHTAVQRPAPATRERRIQVSDSASERVRELEQELHSSRLTLQTVVEELELTNEELQSSNEELHANLEELQSTNEELHSVNEELFSVNSEYEAKLQELSKARKDQENLIHAIDAGIIFINNDRTLRFFSPLAGSFYNLLDQDIGRDLGHITSRLGANTEEILRAIEEVQSSGRPGMLRVSLRNGTHWSVKIKPYINLNREPEGAVITLSETTELEKLRQKAASQRDKLERVLDHVPQGIWEANAQGETTYINQFITRLCGISQREFHLKGWRPYVHPEDLEHFQQSWEQALLCNVAFDSSFRLKAASGAYRWVLSKGVPMLDGQDQVKQWYGSLSDIHDLRASQEELERFNKDLEKIVHERTQKIRLGEERLMLAGEHGTDGFWDWNMLTGEQHLSSKFKALLGYQSHELENSREAWLDLIYEEDRARHAQALEAHMQRGAPYALDLRYHHKDGSVVWAICRGVAEKDEQGHWVRMVGTHTDITALKRAESALRRARVHTQMLSTFKRVVDNAPIKLWLGSASGERTYFSKAWLEYTGRALTEEQGRGWIEDVHPDDRSRLQQQIQAAVEHGTTYSIRYRLMCSDGTYGEVFERAVPYHDDEVLQGYVGSTFDTQDTQTPYAQKLSLLAGGIAHDFNNILTGILMPASMGKLDHSKGSPSYLAFDAIEQGAHRAAELCRLLMDASGGSAVKSEVVQLDEFTQDMLKLVPRLQSPGLTLKLSVAEALPAVLAEPTQLQRVILNILHNAIDALEGHPGALSISLEERSTFLRPPTHLPLNDHLVDGQYVVLEIRDTGKGIARSDIHRIFDPFFTTKVMGRGLGLAAARGAIKAANGGMEVESELGKGTSFRLWLPVAPSQEDDGPISHLEAPPGVLVGSPDVTLLVVDDERPMLSILRQHFEQSGFQVIASDKGQEALELCQRRAPLISFLDFTMPDMMGDELARRLREICPDTRIILMSGYSVEHLESHLDMKLFDALMPKPFELGQVNSAIHQWYPQFVIKPG